MRRKALLTTLPLLSLGLLAVACAPAPAPEPAPAPPDAAALAAAVEQSIDGELLRSHVAALSDDALAGRGPASEGDAAARAYLVEQMTALGLEPGAADGSWEQPMQIVGITSKAPTEWPFLGGRRGLVLSWWDDFIAASGVQEERAEIRQAELVFVGYGIVAPEYGWNDYKDVDVTGKVLLMLNNDPEWDPALFAGERRLYYGRWTYKYEQAAKRGAAGAIIIHTTPSAGYPYQVVQTSWTGEQFELPGSPRSQIEAWVTEAAAAKLAKLAGQDLAALVEAARSADFRPVPFDVTTSLKLRNEIRQVETANVAGLLRGSDPELAREVVVYTAHHDHLGVGEPNDQGDTIYNGALDNGTGCAQVLAIAKAFTELPEAPRRSVLFLFVAAEEQGLLGSRFYAQNPTFAAGRIAANINLDGGNIWGRTTDLAFIGYGKSSLDTVVEAAAARQERRVVGDQFPDRGYFYRSDQFNFAKIGVPAIYLDTGVDFIDRPEGWGKEQIDAWTEIHYHQPSDELTDEWDFTGMVDDARLALECGLAVTKSDELPAWKPGDEFEAARLEALATLGG
ncbi:MAG: M28 family peptidase [Thermoanaerobaculia bacterium]